ncbi:MAG: HDOD domain-containing protein [Lentisphaerae bacterium]|nr:HDOD domain-containing protein [Lentisphaerota bacterium]
MVDVQVDSGELELSIRDLPTIPALIADALRVIDDPGSSRAEIESVVQRDQSLTAQLLRVVNSAAYGFSRRIESVREASIMLGTRKIKGIAGAMVAANLYAQPMAGLVDPLELWTHALAASTWAMEIIDFKRLWHAQSAVVAALLHDLGIVLLCQYATDRYREVLETSRREKLHHVLVEQRVFRTTHAAIGAKLCAKWLMPVGLTQLVNGHHSPDCPTDDALGVVMLADHLAYESGLKPFGWSVAPRMPEGVCDSLGFEKGEYEALQARKDSVIDRTKALLDSTGA